MIDRVEEIRRKPQTVGNLCIRIYKSTVYAYYFSIQSLIGN